MPVCGGLLLQLRHPEDRTGAGSRTEKNRAFQAESAPESSREITGEGLEYPEDTEASWKMELLEHPKQMQSRAKWIPYRKTVI